MKYLILIVSLSFLSPVFSKNCDEEMAEYLDLAESNTEEALEAIKNSKSNCEDKDVFIGTIYNIANDFKNAEKHYKKSIAAKKSVDFAYWQLAGLELAKGNAKKVLEYCQKSLDIKPNYMCYRHAVIVFTSTGEYERARKMYISAYDLNPNLFSDSDLVGAAVYAYTELGEIDMAKGLVVLGTKNNPGSRNSSMFIQAYKHLKTKLPVGE